MKAYRAAILRFDPLRDPDRAAIYEEDGLLVVGQGGQGEGGNSTVHTVHTVQAVGPYRELIGKFPDITVEHLPGRIIAPGFVDMHIHYPQTDVIGSPAPGLLPWLENYTLPVPVMSSSTRNGIEPMKDLTLLTLVHPAEII